MDFFMSIYTIFTQLRPNRSMYKPKTSTYVDDVIDMDSIKSKFENDPPKVGDLKQQFSFCILPVRIKSTN